jgi:adenylosuccinate lyase
MNKQNFSTYQSPFTWRYGSEEMRYIWSEEKKYKIWRSIWIALARAQNSAGIVSKKELDDLIKHQNEIDIQQILENEKETHHDVVAAIREFASKAKIGGGKIHYGATSMDIVDNTDAIRTKESLTLIDKKVREILGLFAPLIEKYADTVCMGFTHLQPAEPTTVGYRLSFYAQDLLIDLQLLSFARQNIKSKGLKGAVGTSASYTAILEDNEMNSLQLEEQVMNIIGIQPDIIATQVYTRKYDYIALTCINSIASSLAKFAADLRLLQSPTIGEWAEPFGKKQVGSSAMPFKRNPINAEKICSLARYIASLPEVALGNATHSYLERTLDDSANKRLIFPEAFLALDEILNTAQKLVSGLVINEKKIAHNLSQYAPFAATEAILMACVKKGASRQEMHEKLRDISMLAWADVQDGKENPMTMLLTKDKTLLGYLTEKEITGLMDVRHHTGTARERSRKLLKEITNFLKK